MNHKNGSIEPVKKLNTPRLPTLRSVVRVGVFLLFLAFPLSDLQGSSHKGGQRTNTRLRLLWRKQIMKQLIEGFSKAQ